MTSDSARSAHEIRAALEDLALGMHRLQEAQRPTTRLVQDYEARLGQATSLLMELEEIRLRLHLIEAQLASVRDSHPTDQAS